MCEGCAGYTKNWLYTHTWSCTTPSTIELTWIGKLITLVLILWGIKLITEAVFTWMQTRKKRGEKRCNKKQKTH